MRMARKLLKLLCIHSTTLAWSGSLASCPRSSAHRGAMVEKRGNDPRLPHCKCGVLPLSLFPHAAPRSGAWCYGVTGAGCGPGSAAAEVARPVVTAWMLVTAASIAGSLAALDA